MLGRLAWGPVTRTGLILVKGRLCEGSALYACQGPNTTHRGPMSTSLLQKPMSDLQTGTIVFFLLLLLFIIILIHCHLSSFIQQIFIEHLVCARHCSGDVGVDTREKRFYLLGVYIPEQRKEKASQMWACACVWNWETCGEKGGRAPPSRDDCIVHKVVQEGLPEKAALELRLERGREWGSSRRRYQSLQKSWGRRAPGCPEEGQGGHCELTGKMRFKSFRRERLCWDFSLSSMLPPPSFLLRLSRDQAMIPAPLKLKLCKGDN